MLGGTALAPGSWRIQLRSGRATATVHLFAEGLENSKFHLLFVSKATLI